jgi:hypothetical protein
MVPKRRREIAQEGNRRKPYRDQAFAAAARTCLSPKKSRFFHKNGSRSFRAPAIVGHRPARRRYRRSLLGIYSAQSLFDQLSTHRLAKLISERAARGREANLRK